MKKYSLVFVALFLVFLLSACGSKEKEEEVSQSKNESFSDQQDDLASQDLFKATSDVSREYVSLRLRTDDVLTKASAYSDYDAWDSDVSQIITDWKVLTIKAENLDEMAGEYGEEKVSFSFINEAQAYSKEEVSNVFDRAPAGQKIKTLAKFLGVDAKRASMILQQDQAQVTADAWNEAGDTFQKLETSAVVIKDGCKIAGFAGGVIITGGAGGFAATSALGQTAVVVGGADLVLEVTEDGANISLGNGNKVSEIIGDVRKITEPTAAILTIVTSPDSLVTGIDKLNTFMFGADQLRSVVQDGKIIGVELPAYKKGEKQEDIKVVAISPEEVDAWLAENGHKRDDGDIADILASAGDKEEADETDQESSAAEKTSKDANSSADAIFVSPAGDTFQRGQAQPWKVELKNFDETVVGADYTCNWIFYLDGKKKYEQLDNRICNFSGITVEDAGKLTVEVTVDFLQGPGFGDKEIVKSVVLSRDFTVTAPVDTYVHP